MRIFILSKYGECLDLAYKLQEEGHDVILSINTESDIGQGIVKIEKGTNGMIHSDLIIIDGVGYGSLANKLWSSGKLVLGGSIATDRIEMDKEFGYELMKVCGIRTPKRTIFNNLDVGIRFIQSSGKQYIFKSKEFTHVNRSQEEAIALLEHLKKKEQLETTAFELHEFIKGIEMSCGGWFDGHKFLKPILPHFEYKNLFGSEISPQMVEMGCVAAYRTKNKLFNETLAKTESFLKTTGYRGYISINCIVTDHGAYGLEWTPRFGYPTIFLQDELHEKGSWGTFLQNLIKGTASSVPADTSKWCVGITYCSSPRNLSMCSRPPIFFPEKLEHIHLRGVKKEDKQYIQAGNNSYACVCADSDVNLRIAKEKAYKVVYKVSTPGGFYRMDIGQDILDNFALLKEWGWIK